MRSRGILDPARAQMERAHGTADVRGAWATLDGRSISRARRTRWASVVIRRLGAVLASGCW